MSIADHDLIQLTDDDKKNYISLEATGCVVFRQVSFQGRPHTSPPPPPDFPPTFNPRPASAEVEPPTEDPSSIPLSLTEEASVTASLYHWQHHITISSFHSSPSNQAELSKAQPLMELLDAATGKPLPEDAIQRVLFIANTAHVYNIPPRPSNQGHVAANWTADPARHIFTARLRVLETSFPSSDATADADELKIDVVLEDPKTGALFAASPYTSAAAVESVLDSSRFFAVTVRDPQGRKAVLGIGYEDRSDAFDFGVALQEARRGLGWESAPGARGGAGAGAASSAAGGGDKTLQEAEKKDYSLKEGQTITVNIGSTGIGRRRAQQQQESGGDDAGSASLQSFALPPPPGPSGGGFSLPPPPASSSSSAADERRRKRQSAQDLGFDDGKFGEFA